MRGYDVYFVHRFRLGKPGPLSIDECAAYRTLDALKRARPRSISVCSIDIPYTRQHQKFKGREPITARQIFDLIETSAGPSFKGHAVVDIHSKTSEGFSNYPVDHLTAIPLLVSYFKKEFPKDCVVVSSDVGRAKEAAKFANELGADLAIVYKKRDENNEIKEVKLLGEVEGRIALLFDDMIDTFGTLEEASRLLKKEKAELILACATFGIFSTDKKGIPAIEKIINSPIDKIIITDCVPHPEGFYEENPWLVVLSMSKLIAQVIFCNHTNLSFRNTLNENLAKAKTGDLDIKIISG